MREILFRGKLKCSGNWMIGCLLVYGNRCFIIPNEELIESEVESRFYWHLLEKNYEVLPETVGQFTGLTDKNGVKIFEGDALKFAPDGDPESHYVVEMSATLGAWIAKWIESRGTIHLSRANFVMEVIGNRFDTPELLEVSGDG